MENIGSAEQFFTTLIFLSCGCVIGSIKLQMIRAVVAMKELDLLTTSDPFPEPIMKILKVVSTATDTPLIMPMAGLLGLVSGCLGKSCFYESTDFFEF